MHPLNRKEIQHENSNSLYLAVAKSGFSVLFQGQAWGGLSYTGA